MSRQEKILRSAFLTGAITDALAIIPMLVPAVARLLWGIEDVSVAYRCGMGYAASLMLGWTALLIWAYRKPMERRGVAALTVVVICGLVLTEVAAVVSGHVPAWWRMLPTWILQTILIAVFAGAFHYSALRTFRARSTQ